MWFGPWRIEVFMQVLNSATNALLGGVPVPPGVFEWPLHGTIAVSTSELTTNVVVGSGDTLVIYPAGVAKIEGVETWQMFLLGVWLVVGVFGIMGIARRMARFLVGKGAPQI